MGPLAMASIVQVIETAQKIIQRPRQHRRPHRVKPQRHH